MEPNKKVNRRRLFKEGVSFFGKVTGEFLAAADEARAILAEEVENLLEPDRALLRPPGAVSEAEFTKLCTSCDDCIKACPEDVLFRADAPFGDKVGTPTFDPKRKACFLCADLHCIVACETGALVKPAHISELAMGKARIDFSLCLAQKGDECQYCLDFCPLTGTAIVKLGETPFIKAAECVGCGLCEYYCRQKTGVNAITTFPRLA